MIRLRDDVRLGIVYKALMGIVDCRLLFLGDHQRQLIRLFEEISYRLHRTKDVNRLYESLRASAEIQQFYKLNRSNGLVSLTLRDEIFNQAGPMEDVEIEVRLAVNGHTLTHPLPLDRLRALGNVVPLLRGRFTDETIRLRLKERLEKDEFDWAITFLQILQENSFLTDRPRLKVHNFDRKKKPSVTFLGHSTLLFQSRRSSILVDPFLRPERGAPTPVADIVDANPGAICCSHSHWDHCHLQSLVWFDKDIPVLVPKVHEPSGFNPPIAPVLKKLGFTDVRELSPWESVSIEDVEMVAIPFYGEQEEPGIPMDHYTYVLKTAGLSVYGGVDCYKDSFGDMKPVLKRVQEEHRPDVAFLPISKLIYSNRQGGVNAYCRYVDNTSIDIEYQYTASPEEAAEWVTILEPRRVVPYAVFTFSRWNIPLEIPAFSRALKRLNRWDRLMPLRTLDSLSSADLQPSAYQELRRRSILFWFEVGAVLKRYHRKLQKHGPYRVAVKVFQKIFHGGPG